MFLWVWMSQSLSNYVFSALISHIAMIAGGIGVTPMLSAFRFLYDLASRGGFDGKRVTLLWTFRDKAILKLPSIRELLERVTANNVQGRFTLSLFCTSPGSAYEQLSPWYADPASTSPLSHTTRYHHFIS